MQQPKENQESYGGKITLLVTWAPGQEITPAPAHHLWQDKVPATGLESLPSFTGIAHSPALGSFLQVSPLAWLQTQ